MNGFMEMNNLTAGLVNLRDDVKKYVEDVRLKSGRSNKRNTLPARR
jgi:hypothetical protein